MIKYSFFALIFVFSILFSCTSDEKKGDDQFFTDNSAENAKDSLAQINKQLDKDPKNVALWIQQGEICKENLDFKCALNAGAKAYKLDSTNSEARQLYAWSLINKPNAPLADIERAQHHFQYILSLQPNDPQTLVDLANTYSLTGDFKTAIKYINDALKIDEEYRDAYVLKGSIYKVMEKNELALSSYQTALQIDPDFFIGQLQTGWLLTKMERHEIALQYYENAVELNPGNVNARYGVAKSLQDLEKYEQSLSEYRKLEKVDSSFYITYFNEGYIKQYYQNQLDSAVYFYDKLLDINPKYVRAWYQLGRTYAKQGRNPDALRAYSEAVDIDSEYTPAKDAAQELN